MVLIRGPRMTHGPRLVLHDTLVVRHINVFSFLFFVRTRQGTSSVHATSRVGPVDPTRARSARATVGARTPPSMLRVGCMLHYARGVNNMFTATSVPLSVVLGLKSEFYATMGHWGLTVEPH